ncbi:flagellar filament capping protein FliD [Halarcobacter bivalviorum]|uniref:flagellar filament capping protein FliD n=1 Tax=Halarcobacter bivalviorum TaxID=663364 RepID=UPI00100AB740|nr:flagellar filament capping protein FliD [Halarcobacter bivalviorum]RXK04776.1 hypothetical protein CRU97_10200 [Halarcobacter bivalviorum]
MADGILGLGSAGSASLNQELIDKLKEAERKSTVEPIENDLEDWTKEQEKFQEIMTKSNELLDAIKPFDLFISSGVSAFDQKSASVAGSSALFDAVDVSNIDEGTTTVKINQLAQKDVYQSNSFIDSAAQITGGNDAGDMLILNQTGRPVYQSDTTVAGTDLVDASGGGSITINIDGVDKTFNVSATTTYQDLINDINADGELNAKITLSGRLSITSADEKTPLTITESLTTSIGLSLGEKYSTVGKTFDDLAADISKNSNYSASIESVGTDTNRLVIKSTDTGLDNKINITQQGFDIGLEDTANNTVKAQNLQASVDGINYDVSSNVLVVGGLKITALEVDTADSSSSISIQSDTSTLPDLVQDIVNKYNELVSLVDNELYSAESPVSDKSSLRSMMEGIKSTLFDSYGENKDLNIFNFGINIDKSGFLTLDTETFNEAVENNLEDLRSLFVGTAESRGLGTQLKEYVDALDSFDGILSKYQENILKRKDTLEEEKTKAQESLDSKYSLLAQQFASYTAIITQFEAQFSGLKLMIQQSTAS